MMASRRKTNAAEGPDLLSVFRKGAEVYLAIPVQC